MPCFRLIVIDEENKTDNRDTKPFVAQFVRLVVYWDV